VSSIVSEDKVIAWTVGLGVKSSNRHCVLRDNNTGATVYFSPMVNRQKHSSVHSTSTSYVVQKPKLNSGTVRVSSSSEFT
jgi:hypothetical protein